MAYRDLLVVLDPSEAASERIKVAGALAERFGAHLVGLYLEAIEMPAPQYFQPSIIEPPYRETEARRQKQAATARSLFEDTARRHAISAEWRPDSGRPLERVALHGRHADLIVVGQLDRDDPDEPPSLPPPEDVTLLAGRPALIVPYAGAFGEVGRRVLIGWDASREAARAIHDALPFLRAAETVTVLTVDKGLDDARIPGADIAVHLARHGVTAQVENTVSAGVGIGEVLLSRASDLGADLLVMGAYGHSRVRELIVGGATRTVLGSMTLPVLMSH
jgi:nucleotide-binding universal stress UspA family protein